MAEEMQGIMGLQNAPMPEEAGRIDSTKFSPVIESYAQNNPREFGRDILEGMSAADPMLVQQFIQELSALQLPTEVIDAMQVMVDDVLADPTNYAQKRTGYINAGVPEELLPEEFDPAYFAALNIALDQLYTNNEAMTMPAFAKGGIVDIKKIAKEIQGMGRNGDTILAHITPSEAKMLRRNGGSGTINPETGLPEFGLFSSIGKIFKGIGKAITGVVKAVGKVVKKIASSTIGKIALTAAAAYFMGPAGFNVAGKLGIANAAIANGVNTFAGSTLVGVASGQDLKTAIKEGVVSGSIAGAATGIFGGGTFGEKAPVAPANQVASTVDDLATLNVATPSTVGPSAVSATGGPGVVLPQGSADYLAPSLGSYADDIAASRGIASLAPTGGPGVVLPSNAFNVAGAAPQAGATAFQNIANQASSGVDTLTQGAKDLYTTGSDFVSSAWNKINPSAIQAQGATAAQEAGMKAISNLPVGTPNAVVSSVYERAYNAAMPGVIGTYGPIAAVGLGGAALMGAFEPPKVELPSNIGEFQTTGTELLQENPQEYGLTYGGVKTTYAPNPYENLSSPGAVQFSAQANPYENLYRGYVLPTEEERRRYLAMQGLGSIPSQMPATMAKGGEAYPRKTGHINGPGTGTSDSVPAMLSDGEFVFTAKAVRAMGNGSRRKGAKRMYALMKQLERKAS